MSPKDPESKRYLSSHRRGYRNMTITPAEQVELDAAAKDAGFDSIKSYLMSLHRQRQTTRNA